MGLGRKEKKDWFNPKRYVHLDMPLSFNDRAKLLRLLRDSEKVALHSFLPLMHRCHYMPKYKKINGKARQRFKERHIFYASHWDSQIYSYYSMKLMEQYELWLTENHLTRNIIAYRPIKGEDGRGMSHLDFAKEIFDAIVALADVQPVGVVIADISGFFDSLDHNLLKKEWSGVMECDMLPPDHYNVFKSITRFSFVEQNDVFNRFKNELICQHEKNGSIITKRVKEIRFLRDNGVIAFCTSTDIAKVRKCGLIKKIFKGNVGKDGKRRGIPQGLPISATLANVYMRSFDVDMKKLVESVGGVYRRYSDDIAVVVPLSQRDLIALKMRELIKRVALEIKEEKTKNYAFFYDKDGKLGCYYNKSTEGNTICVRRNLDYLGLSFDGCRILLRSRSISRYYQKMARDLRRKKWYALNINNKTKGRIFEDSFLRRFSYLGRNPHSSFSFIKEDGRFVVKKNNRKKYGNYFSYVKRASALCDVGKRKNIWKQLRRNLAISRKSLANTKKEVAKEISRM